jgi:hypothetical protein
VKTFFSVLALIFLGFTLGLVSPYVFPEVFVGLMLKMEPYAISLTMIWVGVALWALSHLLAGCTPTCEPEARDLYDPNWMERWNQDDKKPSSG